MQHSTLLIPVSMSLHPVDFVYHSHPGKAAAQINAVTLQSVKSSYEGKSGTQEAIFVISGFLHQLNCFIIAIYRPQEANRAPKILYFHPQRLPE